MKLVFTLFLLFYRFWFLCTIPMGDLYESSVDDDQHFLLFFIMGTYFGPDLKGEEPQLSVLKRIAEGLPPYTSNQLAGSHIKTVELEQVYYYVLRKADQSFVVNIPLMYQFFHGILPTDEQDPAANYPQFSDLFPPLFHPHLQFKNQYRIVKNIVFINNPETFYINKEDIERFKRLTRLDGFLLDKDAARSHAIPDCGVLCYGAVQVADPIEESPSLRLPLKSRKTRRIDDLLECSNLPDHDHVISPTETDLDPEKSVGPAMIFLPSLPAKTEWSNIVTAARSGFALTGSAAIGKVGPIIGLTDIGECEDAYLFRVCLPGVERDESKLSF